MTNGIHRPAWVPLHGHRLRVAGVHFDAVRIEGRWGEAVADWLIERGDGDAGPVVCAGGGGTRWVYFLLAPGVVHRHHWPLGVQYFGRRIDRTTVTYVGVPALDGETWPLRWYSEPTPTAPYVDAEALLAVTSPAASPADRRSPRP